MTVLTEGRHTAEGLVSEANGNRSRETITILSGQDLEAMTVLGMIEVGSASAVAAAGNTGDGTIGTIAVGAGAKAGDYKLTFIEPATNAGQFIVEDPDGVNIGTGTVAVEFDAGGLTFTVADGAADFVAGDQFTITVATGSLKHVRLDETGTDGRQNAAAILYAAVDATGGDKKGVAIVRDAEVVEAALGWNGTINQTEKNAAVAQLKKLGIIAR